MADSEGVRSTRTVFISVGVKLAGATLLLVALLAATVYVGLSRYERNNLMRAKEAAASMVVRLFVAGAVAPLTFADEKGVEEQVGLLRGNEDIVYAAVWGTSESSPTELGQRLGELRRGTAPTPPRHIPVKFGLHRTDRIVTVESPVVDPANKTIGGVQVAFSLAKEHAAVAQVERQILTASIVSSLVFAAVLLALARLVIVKPLSRLVQAANALERGDQATLTVTSNDEIGKLATAFSAMSNAIVQRERRIKERNHDMRNVLDNVEEGFLTTSLDGKLSDEYSRILDTWFGGPAPNATLFDYFGEIAGPRAAEWLRVSWDSLTDGLMPLELIIDQLPNKFERDDRFYTLSYRPMLDEGTLRGMLVVIRDVTDHVEHERAEQVQRETLVIFERVIRSPYAFHEFFQEANTLVEKVVHSKDTDDATLRRLIHTLKGNTAIFGLESVSRFCHELESRLLEAGTRPTLDDLAGLKAVWSSISDTYKRFQMGSTSQIVIDIDEQRELLRAIRGGLAPVKIAEVVTSWRYERADRRLRSVAEQIRQVAKRLGKGDVQVDIAPTHLRVAPQRWAPFWSVFAHVIRNTVDHAYEPPEVRRASGKPDELQIALAFSELENSVVFQFTDDGPGIDWERLAARAASSGLPHSTPAELEEAIYADGVSTREQATQTSGRGVGMGAVRDCVRELGGTITIDSQRGKGTTFTFTFPLAMLWDEMTLSLAPARLPSLRAGAARPK